MHTYPVGADDSVRPQTAPVFAGIYGESVAAQRADVGIGPYMTPANSCCPANFECKAFLPQSFKGSCYQIWCIVTGGAYQIARRVSTCVRNICKSDSCLNRTAGCTPRPQAPLFSPIFSGKTEKIGPSETTSSRKSATTSQSRLRRASIPTPFVPSGHFPLIGGIGPWEGSLFTGSPAGGIGSRGIGGAGGLRRSGGGSQSGG